jgi:hypothetical protein
MSFTQGSPLPDVRTTQTTSDQAPQYYTDYLTGLTQAGRTAMERTGEASIADYDPLQIQGYGALPGAAESYKPGLSAAQQSAATASAGITPERIQALMNPYTTNVVDEMARLSQQNVQRNLLPTMRAGFVGTGGLGSQRYANALGQSMADIQAGLTGQQYGALSKGYSDALKSALEEAQLQNQTARTQGELAKIEQDLGLTGAGALTKAGAERQAYEQSILDAPMKTATAASGLMRGYTVPTTKTETFVGPKAGVYSQSPLASILGVGTMLGAAGQGSLLSSLGSGIAGGLGKLFSSSPDYSNLTPDQIGAGGASLAEQDFINSILNGSNTGNSSSSNNLIWGSDDSDGLT